MTAVMNGAKINANHRSTKKLATILRILDWRTSECGCRQYHSKSREDIMLEKLCSKKSDAKIQITITMAYLIRIKYPLSGFNYNLSDVNVANFNKIHRTVSKQQLFKKWNSKTEVANMENTD